MYSCFGSVSAPFVFALKHASIGLCHMSASEETAHRSSQGNDRLEDGTRILYTDSSGAYEEVSTQAEPPASQSVVRQENQGRPRANRAEIASAFIAGAALVISVFALVGLYFTWRETRATAKASICASNIASASLNLTRRVFEASQAARLEQSVDLNISNTRNVIRVTLTNAGTLPAKHVVVVVGVSGMPDTPFVLSSVSKFRTMVIPLTSSAHPKQYIRRPLQVETKVSYENGIETVHDTFCTAVVVSQYDFSRSYENCNVGEVN